MCRKLSEIFSRTGVFTSLIFGRNYGSGSYYVNKARVAEYMKRDDSSLLAEFKRSRFLFFVDKAPLLQRLASAHYIVSLIPHGILSKVATSFDFEVDHRSAALIDIIPMQGSTNDLDEEFLPVLALNIRSSFASDSSKMKKLESELNGELVDLRRAFFLVNDRSSLHLLAKGQSLLRWAHSTRFCSRCAAPLQMKVSKASAKCTKCSAEFYPRIAPVAITLISDEKNEHALLVRQPRHPANLFTAVAGFAEMGEAIEETARREVAEEVGVDVITIKYANISQPWPFPQMSLMCGFFATAHGLPQPIIDRTELEDAAWFSRSEVKNAFLNSLDFASQTGSGKLLANQKISFVPPPGSVAHELIKQWISEGR